MSRFNIGDRVKIVQMPRDEHPELIGRHGTVEDVALFVWVRLDEMPETWKHPEGLPCMAYELEKL